MTHAPMPAPKLADRPQFGEHIVERGPRSDMRPLDRVILVLGAVTVSLLIGPLFIADVANAWWVAIVVVSALGLISALWLKSRAAH